MPPGANVEKLVKLRTYQDDFERARKANGLPVAAPAEKHPAPEPTPSVSIPEKSADRAVSQGPRPVSRSVTHSPIETPPPPPQKISVPQVPHTESPRRIASSATQREPDTTRPTLNQHTTAIAHDLSKIHSQKRASILATEDSVFDVQARHDGTQEGSIVTDTVHGRFRLFPAIAAAFKEWLFEKKEDYEERQKPKHTVVPAAERKEIVARAASVGALAPKDDHARVAQRLRHVPRTSSVKELEVKKADEVPEPSWTHTEEESVTPVDAGEVLIQPEPIRQEESLHASDASAVSPTMQREPEPEKAPIVEPPKPAEPEMTAPPAPVLPPTPEVMPKTPEPVAEVAVPESKENIPAAPATAADPVRIAPRTKRPAYPFIIAGVFATVLGVGAAVWFFGGDSTGQVVPTTEVSSLFAADHTETVALGSTHDQMLDNLTKAAKESGEMSITKLQLVVTQGDGEERPATTEELLLILNPRAPGSFIRAITNIEFGVYRGSEPFIILKVAPFDTALGGMLAWEEAMSADLAPLFGTPVTSTFDPAARTATQTREPFFVDIVHVNRDMRVLSDAEQDERIVYSFLNRTTILISTDRTVIEELAPLIH